MGIGGLSRLAKMWIEQALSLCQVRPAVILDWDTYNSVRERPAIGQIYHQMAVQKAAEIEHRPLAHGLSPC